jgi:hypothetical protein
MMTVLTTARCASQKRSSAPTSGAEAFMCMPLHHQLTARVATIEASSVLCIAGAASDRGGSRGGRGDGKAAV